MAFSRLPAHGMQVKLRFQRPRRNPLRTSCVSKAGNAGKVVFLYACQRKCGRTSVVMK